ncbi:MAG TPA: hypothetical protein VLV50_18750 [Stellaceae bacterium]|nr:hypothetical protein [Stellaceae bacterium]
MPAREVWRLVGPWLGYLVLGAAGIFGLFTASASADAATYDAGLIAFAIAVVLIAVRMKRQFDGTEAGFLLPISPAGADTLFVTVAILAVLGLVGAVLAAAVGGMLYGIGLALFIVCAALIFIEVKRYFDRLDRGL